MNLSNLTSTHFRKIVSLLDKKEALQAQIADLEREVGELLNGVDRVSDTLPAGAATDHLASGNVASPRSGQGAKRGELKEAVLTELKNAGEAGVSVKELADKLEMKIANLHAWFGSTGKKITGLKKIGPARYSLATESIGS